MSRSIKFRAWDPDRKIMENNIVIIDGEAIKRGYISTSWTDNSKAGDFIMQYTGLLDKQGAEIYEGDVVKIDNSILEVVFSDGCFCVIGVNLSYKEYLHIDVGKYSTKVVGNIYENPELLEGEDDE